MKEYSVEERESLAERRAGTLDSMCLKSCVVLCPVVCELVADGDQAINTSLFSTSVVS